MKFHHNLGRRIERAVEPAVYCIVLRSVVYLAHGTTAAPAASSKGSVAIRSLTYRWWWALAFPPRIAGVTSYAEVAAAIGSALVNLIDKHTEGVGEGCRG